MPRKCYLVARERPLDNSWPSFTKSIDANGMLEVSLSEIVGGPSGFLASIRCLKVGKRMLHIVLSYHGTQKWYYMIARLAICSCSTCVQTKSNCRLLSLSQHTWCEMLATSLWTASFTSRIEPILYLDPVKKEEISLNSLFSRSLVAGFFLKTFQSHPPWRQAVVFFHECQICTCVNFNRLFIKLSSHIASCFEFCPLYVTCRSRALKLYNKVTSQPYLYLFFPFDT